MMSSSGHRIMCIYRPRPVLNYGLCDKAIYTNSMYSVGDGTHTKPCAHHLLQRLQDVQLQGDATSVRPACDAVYVARASKKHCWSIQVSFMYFDISSWNSSVISNTWSSHYSELSCDTRSLCFLTEASSRVRNLNMQMGSASFYPFKPRYPDTCTEAISYS